MINKNRFLKYKKGLVTMAVIAAVAMTMTACGSTSTEQTNLQSVVEEQTSGAETSNSDEAINLADSTESSDGSSVSSTGSILDTSDMFTERDLTQTADLTDATTITLTDGEDVHITEEGVYLLQGSASEVTVYVEAEDTDKVQLVLDGVSITNSDQPCIYVVSADKVFVTTSSDSSLTVTDSFVEDEENADAVIFSRQDLVLNGTATLTIESSDAAVDCKDDLKITGGSYVVTAGTKAFDANDSIRIADGNFTLVTGTDGFHAENTDDDSLGYIYIENGSFDIQAGDDGIHGTSVIQIDGGTFTIDAVEAIEATYVQINDGTFSITASDDGINASNKSTAYNVTIEITGGDITISMGSGDTDALDANGDLIISGGTLDITANSAFDYDGNGTLSGATVTVNGEEVTELTQSMMGGGGRMSPNGDMGGRMQQDGEMPDADFDGEMPDGEMPDGDFDGNMQPGGNNGQMQPPTGARPGSQEQ